ncbi:NarK family nitrate/nitrite MFS transporter [Silvimonas amylolytica]|uniref:Nitrate/nitrite transporter n=1 Tax=Silvimonas amylolytica TaxID=449663 RepID=A0ABQ2PIX0_9NEIS|nr:nitrite extrusion protein [Silvimonas amylolytica]
MANRITRWEPNNQAFWESEGERIAKRNLWISIPCLLLAFSTWVVWSVVVLKMPQVGFHYTKNQLFMLTALPSLSGATLRIFYSFMPSLIGGRKWTTISTASLLIPSIWLGFALQDPNTPFSVMLVIALLCGFGGGNFSSSMANIAWFFPKTRKGWANGMNAGLGNLGVSVMQFLVPIVITMSIFGALGGQPQTYTQNGAEHQMWLQNAGFVWVPLVIAATLAAWFGMNDLAVAEATVAEQAVIFKRADNWMMCWLYLGTFGSFIGFSAGFALLTKTQFPEINVTDYAFIGPLIGAIIRPVGGTVSDKLGGGARVTMWVFVLMAAAIFGVLYFLPHTGADGNPAGGSFWGFFLMFQALFLLSGIGNGSTYKMIPVIFPRLAKKEAEGKGEAAEKKALLDGAVEAAAAGGFISAIGAYGGYFIPQSFGVSMDATGSAEAALYAFIVFYITCVLLCWWRYARKGAAMPC